MDLILDQPDGFLFIRRYADDGITIVDRVLRHSFILARQQVIEDWPVRSVEQLDETRVDTILALQPELVLLGTGPSQRFPASAILARFVDAGVGVEVMSNAAVARTHGLLAAEGRNLVSAFILAGEPARPA